MILHVVPAADWEAAQRAGELRPASLSDAGFIHFCTREQLDGVIERFHAEVPDLLVLSVDPAPFGDALRWEQADGDSFPHLYAPLPVSAVAAVRRLT